MATKRIIDLQEASVSEDMWVMTDNATTGTKRFNAKTLFDATANAQAATTAANTAAGQASTAATNATTAAGTANTAASNADAKAALADTAAANADTATQAANTATTNATNAAQAANNAADLAIEAAETITDGYFPHMLAGAAETLMDETDTATFAERVSTHDGVARIESILGNTVVSEDSLLNVNMEGVRTVGFNILDGNWTVRGSSIITDYIPVVAGQTYYCNAGNVGTEGIFAMAYDVEKNDIGRVGPGGFPSTARINNTTFGIPQNQGIAYMRVWVNNAADVSKTCINLSWSGYRNGEYEEYWTQERAIDTAAYFPDGMKSAGSVHDELTATKAVKRVGVVDLGTLTWSREVLSDGETHYFMSPMINDRQLGRNLKTVKYALASGQTRESLTTDNSIAPYNATNTRVAIRDDSYTDAAAFKAAMSGVLLYYELAEPVETEITPSLNMTYTVEQGGTESIVIPTGEQSAAPTLAIVYGVTIDGVVDKALSVIAPIEGSTASTNYSVNAYLVHDQQLYRVTSAIATGEAITPGSNCVACTVMGEVIRLTA